MAVGDEELIADDSSSDDSTAASDEDEASSAADLSTAAASTVGEASSTADLSGGDDTDGWSEASASDDDESSVGDDDSSADDQPAPRPPAATRSGRPVRPPRALGPDQGGRYTSVARGAMHVLVEGALGLRGDRIASSYAFFSARTRMACSLSDSPGCRALSTVFGTCPLLVL